MVIGTGRLGVMFGSSDAGSSLKHLHRDPNSRAHTGTYLSAKCGRQPTPCFEKEVPAT